MAFSSPSREPNVRSLPPLSSPEHGYQDIPELTPRSKVKAMLAAIDTESDEEASSHPSAVEQKRQPLAPVTGNRQNKETIRTTSVPKDPLEREHESEEDAIIPRGRVAARLNVQVTKRRSFGSDDDDSGSENAYSRIKRKLVANREELQKGANTSEEERDCQATIPCASPSPQSRQASYDFAAIRESRSPSVANPPALRAIVPRVDVDDIDQLEGPTSNNRFQELIAKKRAEREAKEAEEERKRQEVAEQRKFEQTLSQDDTASDGVSGDNLVEKHLTHSSRPTRKASKKALEEMNRETQRMNRSMQLAHQARTKKKISKDSLFARFNFRTAASANTPIPEQPSSSTIPSSAAPSDAEVAPLKESPLTSPASSSEHILCKSILRSTRQREPAENAESSQTIAINDEDLPDFADILSQPPPLNKGKAVVRDSEVLPLNPPKKPGYSFKQRPVRVSLLTAPSKVESVDLDSDSDLEIQSKLMGNDGRVKMSKLDAFGRAPAEKREGGNSLLILRALAHINSPDERPRNGNPLVTMTDMQISLQKRARLQALEERKAKIEDLKARGVFVQSTEEREKDQAEVEDLLEKARREAGELQQKEQKAARKARIANGEADILESSDDDGDYADGEDNETVDLSGSEEEDAVMADAQGMGSDDNGSEHSEDGEDLDLDDEGDDQNVFVDGQAEDAGQEGEDEQGETSAEEEAQDEAEDDLPRMQSSRTRKNRIAIEDDEDEDLVINDKPEVVAMEAYSKDTLQPPTLDLPQIPPMFGATDAAGLPFGMTQAFAATMAETQPDFPDEHGWQDDSMTFMGPPPEPNLPLFAAQDSLQLVPDSQDRTAEIQETVDRIDLQFSQSQLQYDTLGPTQLQREVTGISEIPDPTQDAGFILSSPAPERFNTEPPSTVDTVVIPRAESTTETPLVQKRRGRLVRRVVDQPDSDQDDLVVDKVSLPPRNAFKTMNEKRKRKADAEAYDKKKSEAKEMVEDQAAESEDEYAGLGGASDDESGGEEDENIKAMMDHGEVDVDEGKLAALYADKERASDGKAVEKLFKDLNNGGLRRKRGADLDLSDSDDDAEARRRRKQREFAKMRKALLADEKVGQIAEDPKKIAFLRAIEDRENDEDLDFLDKPPEDSFRVEVDTQEDGSGPNHSQSQPPSISGPTRADSFNDQNRPLQITDPNMRPPATSRRTAAKTTAAAIRKPSTLAEIRDSVSFLVETPGVTTAPDASSSASEPEDNTTNPHSPTKRQPKHRTSAPIIDRLLLKRSSTTSSATSSSTNTTNRSRLAFHDPSSTSTTSLPSLLLHRRNTASSTSSSFSTTDKNGISTYAPTERATAGGHDDNSASGAKHGFKARGTGKSSVNCFAREVEKEGARVVAGLKRRRREEREKKGRERRGASNGVRGLFLGGGFD